MIDKLSKIPLRQQPGSMWHYSVAVDVQGYLVEVLSGQPFDEFLNERVFGPLGMNDTAFHVAADKADRFSQVYTHDADGNLMAQEGFGGRRDYLDPPAFLSGGGGLVSTTMDYMRFSQMLLNGGELDGVRILAPSTVKLTHLNPARTSAPSAAASPTRRSSSPPRSGEDTPARPVRGLGGQPPGAGWRSLPTNRLPSPSSSSLGLRHSSVAFLGGRPNNRNAARIHRVTARRPPTRPCTGGRVRRRRERPPRPQHGRRQPTPAGWAPVAATTSSPVGAGGVSSQVPLNERRPTTSN